MGCISTKSSKNKKKSTKSHQESSQKKSRENEQTHVTETFPEELTDRFFLQQPEMVSFFSSNSVNIDEEDYKVYALEYLDTETILLEYSISSHILEKISLDIHLFPESGSIRLSSGLIMCAGGIDLSYNSEIKNCFLINPDKREIIEICEMLYVKRKLRLVQVEDYVYAIGGVKESRIVENNHYTLKQDYNNSFSRYSITKNHWEALQDLPIGVEYPGCFEINRKIYVTGGCYIQNSPIILDKMQVYNILDGVWVTLEINLPKRLFGHLCAIVDNNKIIIVGGVTEESLSNSECWIFDTKNISEFNKIAEGYELFFPFYSNVFKGEIYCFSEENLLLMFNLRLSVWTIISTISN